MHMYIFVFSVSKVPRMEPSSMDVYVHRLDDHLPKSVNLQGFQVVEIPSLSVWLDYYYPRDIDLAESTRSHI